MAKLEIESVDDYIAAQPEPTARALELVRSAIRKGLPKAEEVISYKMKTLRGYGVSSGPDGSGYPIPSGSLSA
jgi:uncharacterized protein YdhG (YjbR/CyaY superfamily)